MRPDESDRVEEMVMKHFQDTRRIENNRYVVSWPWKVENPRVPSLYHVSKRRLEAMLKSTPDAVLAKSMDILSKQKELGIIEEAPRKAGKVYHYLPWRPILEKDGKVRLVNDASAKPKDGPSLNDLIHVGPSLTKNLVGLLLHFQLRAVAMTADIEKAFLQIGLDERDRDSVRILNVKDYTKPVTPGNLEIDRFTHMPFGVNACPYLLNMIVQDVFSEDPENFWYQIGHESFYVDNLLVSLDTEVEALQLNGALTEKLASVSFNLGDWTSNSEKFRKFILEDKLSLKSSVSVLGLLWDIRKDLLSFPFDEGSTANSLHSALSCLQQVFDPLGYVAPSLLDLKLFVQECWKGKLTWDQVLPDVGQVRASEVDVGMGRNSLHQHSSIIMALLFCEG